MEHRLVNHHIEVISLEERRAMMCQTCGKIYDPTDTAASFHFSCSSHGKGTYISPHIISALGEEILTCPSDPMEELDEAMREGDRIQDYDLEGEETV